MMKKHSGFISLSIDTSDSEMTSVILSRDGTSIEKISDRSHFKSQVLIPLIEELLHEQHISLGDVSEIKLNVGPGSFTGLRVGVTVAQTLGKLLNVPVNGKPAGETALVYQKSKWE